LEQLIATAINLNHAEFREFAHSDMDKLSAPWCSSGSTLGRVPIAACQDYGPPSCDFRPVGFFNVKRFFNATINSLRAIGYGFRREAALREEMIALAAGLIAAVFIAPTVAWYMAMIASLLGLLAVEFLNVAIEKLSDHVTPEEDKAIGRIKDYGSAAVFSAICLAGLTWLAALAIRVGLI
jgi:diacylglycerol kinase (ATP)